MAAAFAVTAALALAATTTGIVVLWRLRSKGLAAFRWRADWAGAIVIPTLLALTFWFRQVRHVELTRFGGHGFV